MSLRNATVRPLLIYCVVGVFAGLVVPPLLFASSTAGYTCEHGLPDSGWCATNDFDVAVTSVLVMAPKVTGLTSHLFTFVACPFVALSSVLAPLRAEGEHQAYMPRAHAKQDAVIWISTQLMSAGANTIAKKGFRRQRPCYHFEQENETEAIFLPNQQWVSFYSGDTAMAWSFVAAAFALASARGRGNTPQLARLGGTLACIGSVFRITGFMHWATDVITGVFFGCLIGAGLPTVCFRAHDGHGGNDLQMSLRLDSTGHDVEMDTS